VSAGPGTTPDRVHEVERLLGATFPPDYGDLFAGLVTFGGDGGGEAFCFDERGHVVMVAFISAREDHRPLGTFRAFVRALADGLPDA
jgi:hypothetical protein